MFHGLITAHANCVINTFCQPVKPILFISDKLSQSLMNRDNRKSKKQRKRRYFFYFSEERLNLMLVEMNLRDWCHQLVFADGAA